MAFERRDTFRSFRRFHLVRDEDVSGVSSLAELEAIHGHEGRTHVVFVDEQ